MKGLTWLALAIGIFLPLAGYGQESSKEKTGAADEARQAVLNWELKTLVDPYEAAGHTSPKWDSFARTALTEFARLSSDVWTQGENYQTIISNACVSASKAGCDDPMMRYLSLGYASWPPESRTNSAEAYCQVAMALANSSYPATRKYWTWLWARDQVYNTYGTNIPKAIAEIDPQTRAESEFSESLRDKTMPPEKIYQEAYYILKTREDNAREYGFLYRNVVDTVVDARAKTAPLLLLKGTVFVDKAWQARGSGWANTVNAEGWAQFGHDLDVAREALEKAWKLNSSDPRIPTQMLRVELGQGNGRDEMEVWFKRAMTLNTNDYDACWTKLQFLAPKWHGSAEELLAFGHECVTNGLWGGQVPLILVDVHRELRMETPDGPSKRSYWKQPEVWADVKMASDKYLQLNPWQIHWYNNYAWYAYHAEQWSTFNDLILKAQPIDYKLFGGRENFGRMFVHSVELAKSSQAASSN